MWLVFSIIFGILCALIASNKNRSVGVAALCGSVFGIFALIYYIAVSKNEKEK